MAVRTLYLEVSCCVTPKIALKVKVICSIVTDREGDRASLGWDPRLRSRPAREAPVSTRPISSYGEDQRAATEVSTTAARICCTAQPISSAEITAGGAI